MFEIEKVRKIFYVDLLFTFVLLNGYITSQFTFINGIFAFLISVAFIVGMYCLISTEWLINVILSVVYSIFGSMLLVNIIPFRRWTNNNIILLVVIGILCFIGLLLLHAFQILYDISHKRTTYRKYEEYAYRNYFKTHSYEEKYDYQSDVEQENKRIDEEKKQEEARQEESPKQSDSNIDESLFSGCNSKESLTRRYKQLMKTFHPDNQDGDTNMTIKIQKTYEILSKKYE